MIVAMSTIDDAGAVGATADRFPGATRPRVAITIGTLRIPPTYFAVQHALRLRDRFDFAVLALAAQVEDPVARSMVRDFVPGRSGPFRRREVVIPAAIPLMSRALNRTRPHVIHQHFATWSWSATAAARAGTAPLVTTLHGVDAFTARVTRPATAMQRWHLRNIARARETSARVLAVSRFLADVAVAAGFDARRLDVHYQGIDTDYFTPVAPPTRADVPTVAFVGALNEAKGVRDLLDASVALTPEVPHRLVVVGTGPLLEEVRQRAAEHPHVVVRGGLPRDTVRELLRESDALVLPSKEHRGWQEAAGLVLLEAQACGTPVVAYRSGGKPEMLVEGKTGLLVDDEDVRALTSAVREILQMPEAERRRMREDARSFVVAERSLSVSADHLAAVYDDLAGR